MKIMNIRLILTVIAFLLLFSSIFAVDPPGLINYQGILRDSSDKPLNASYDMTFTFFSASSGGDEILIDQHLDVGTGAVTVTDGLFNAWLGGGNIFDGSGPGTYTTLPKVFSDYTDVYLEIEIYNADTTLWEVLNPRIRIISAAYALNADTLDGKNSIYFLDTSSTAQTKSGKAIFNASTGNYGVEGYGPTAGGYFKDSTQSGYAYIGYGDYGIDARGNAAGGYFKDLDNSGYAYVGYVNYGIRGYGTYGGGYFSDSDDSGYAFAGTGNVGIRGYGTYGGGYFSDSDDSGYAYVGYANYGIDARGNAAGGYFKDENNSGYAYVGYANDGIQAYGNNSGGYFNDLDSSGYAWVGSGDNGISAHGNSMGGYFSDLNSSGYAYVGYWDYGISAYGNLRGGYFSDLDHSGLAYVGYGDRGIWGKGTFAGATFSHPDNTTFWADVSTSTSKILGTGSVSFVQNHPYDKSKVITYAAPEGDEVAVYTRGTGRLINGETLVKLGESFSWVANPDIGLTAHITPRGEQGDLWVDTLTTSEMTVRGPEGSNAVFDYIVFGLRIGFEELAVVQEKDREAFLPASEAVQEPYAQNPDLRAFNAFERFKRMHQVIGETGEIDLTRSLALVNSIDENKQVILAKAREQMEMEKKQLDQRPEENQEPMPESLEGTQQPHPGSPEPIERAEKTIAGTIPMDEEGNIHAKSFRSVSPDLTGNVPVSEQAEVGDILVIDPMNPGMMRLCDTAVDQGVVGIVAGEPGVVLGGSSMDQIDKLEVDQEKDLQMDEGEETSEELIVEFQQTHAPIALSGIVQCKVDAGYGAIQAGDLLTTSQTIGHAMRSDDHAAGTIIGKALEPLDAGTGLIKVLVMMR
jgi:hypothetical protein